MTNNSIKMSIKYLALNVMVLSSIRKKTTEETTTIIEATTTRVGEISDNAMLIKIMKTRATTDIRGNKFLNNEDIDMIS